MTREHFLTELAAIAEDIQTEEDIAFLSEKAIELKEHDEVLYNKFVAMVHAMNDLQKYAKTLIGASIQTLN